MYEKYDSKKPPGKGILKGFSYIPRERKQAKQHNYLKTI